MRLLASALMLALSAAPAARAAITWSERPGEALEAARESGRPVLVDLWAVWCAPCKVMDETTYRDPGIVELADWFVPLKIDVDAQAGFVERYDVEAYPTILFLDGHGRELGRIEGLVTATQLTRRLETIRAGYPPYLESVDRPDDPGALLRASLFLMDAGNLEEAGRRLKKALRLARDANPAARDEIELALARSLWLGGQDEAAARRCRKLSEQGATPDLRDRARAALAAIEAERP